MSVRIACCFLAACLAGCSGRDDPAADGPTRTASRALGTSVAPISIGERCLDCHAEIVASYRKTGMARAVEPVRAGELASLRSVGDGAGWNYRFEQDGSAARIVESWRGGATAVTGEILFAIGAGWMDRSYAAAVGDLMWFAPLEVVGSGSARHAAMAPGHMIRPGLRFTVPILDECLACHTDNLPVPGYPLNLRPDSHEGLQEGSHEGSNAEPPAWQPSGISCAACHGDVEGHATWREGELSGGRPSAPDPIFPGAGKDWVESVSSCARCHLQGDASFLLEPGARGAPPPGGDLLDRRAVFIPRHATDEVGFVSQVERMVLSPCFTRSLEPGREPMTCVTCHDPHRSSFEADERPRVRAACNACHRGDDMHCALPETEWKRADCVQCHMRRTPVFDVAGVEIHDHFIRTRPPPPRVDTMRVKESTDGDLVVFAWPGKPRPSYAEDPGLRMMARMIYGRPDLALPDADRVPGKASARLPTYHHLRGSLLESASRTEDARSAFERALALEPGLVESSVDLALVLAKLGRPRDALSRLDAVIAAHPKTSNALRNRAVVRLQLGDAEGFASDLETSFRISPSAVVAGALAEHHRKAGRAKDAERWQRAARSVDPSGGSH